MAKRRRNTSMPGCAALPTTRKTSTRQLTSPCSISRSTPTLRHRRSESCLSCGNCFECDNCYAACPEDAIIKLGPNQRYKYDYTKCTGCAVCFEQCPCHAIEMVPEPA